MVIPIRVKPHNISYILYQDREDLLVKVSAFTQSLSMFRME